jgi:uncharacterized protein YkwD
MPSLLGWRSRRRGAFVVALAGLPLACAGALVPVASGAQATAAGASAASAHGGGAGCRGANVRPNSTDLAAVDAATLCLIDGVRRAHALAALRANRELAGVAAAKVTSMVRDDYFADVAPSGRTPLSLVAATRYRAHAARVAVGESLAWGAGGEATPAHVVARWLASPPHREILLSGGFRDAGVAAIPAAPALVHAGRSSATYAIELGARL